LLDMQGVTGSSPVSPTIFLPWRQNKRFSVFFKELFMQEDAKLEHEECKHPAKAAK
jgi:hypothetical protein